MKVRLEHMELMEQKEEDWEDVWTISIKREQLSLSLKFFGVGYGPWILKD